MKDGVVYTGIPSSEELKNCPGIPSEERMRKGRVAVIECVQEIPCNPCEAACKFGAIKIGAQITALPVLDEDKCTGCGLCIPGCPGLAICVVDKSGNDGNAVVEFPFEYVPLPKQGEIVEAVNRAGERVCYGEAIRVRSSAAFGGTTIVSLRVPEIYVDEVRSMKRLPAKDCGQPEQDNSIVVCRCREVTKQDILDAIADGATTVSGVKRRSTACMGLCQGKTCERLVAKIISEETGRAMAEIVPQKSRMPVRPVKISVIGGGDCE